MSILTDNSGRANPDRLLPRVVSARRGGMVVAALLAVIGLVFVWQASLLDFGGFDLPGPGFFPLVLGVVVFALSTLIAIEGWPLARPRLWPSFETRAKRRAPQDEVHRVRISVHPI